MQSSPGVTSGAPTSASLPPRPREFKLDGIDPCKLLTTDQMQQLAVVKAIRNDSNLFKAGPTPTCDYLNSDTGIGYGVTLGTSKGLDYWLTGSGNVDVKPIQVSSYGAVELKLTGTLAFDCAVAVDVAQGQQLYVDFIPTTTIKPSQDVMCGNAAKGAGLALATLQTSR
jgi:hypothetical protein